MLTITVARALTAHFARRIVRMATIGALIIFVSLAGITWLLVYFFNPLWWLLLVPAFLLLAVYFVVRLAVLFIIRRIHTEHLSKDQTDALNVFADKVQSLIEARSTPLPIFVIICLKDLLLHRDITTIKAIIRDSASLKSDYKKIEQLF